MSLANESIDQVIDALREFDIGIRHAAGIVRGELQQHARVADVDLGMVLCLFDNFRHAIDEIDRVIELFKLDNADDGFLFVFPLRTLFKSGMQFVFF